ncbi:MAG: E3 ubiquitin protein ligase [Candidatus Heimdallarchaeota archaeon]|nr:E3 ubiquitin protein ligase [Candidatus Heimdallarchaeota archaeon]
MNIRKLQPVKLLVLSYCISLIALAVRDFRYIYVDQIAYFFVIFLTPIIITAVTIVAYELKRRRLIHFERIFTEYSVLELIGVILLEGAYIFGLFMAWHGVSLLTTSNFVLFVIIAIFSNSLFVVYLVLWINHRLSKRLETIETINRVATVVKKKKKKIEYDKITELLGFSSDVSFNEIEGGYTFIVPEDHIYADFFERIKVVYDEVFKGISIVLKLKSDSLLSLDIRKRDSIFSNQRKEFSISPLSNVYSLNSQTPEIWENLLSDPIFQQNLLLLRPYFEHFSLKGEYVEALVYSDTTIVKLIDWVMEMNPSMELMSKIIDASDADILLCYNCQDPFDPLEETCTNCGSARPRCIICFQDLKPEEEDDVVMLPCCEIYAHRDHIMTWLRKKSICPNCHSSLTRWMNQTKLNRGF